MAKSLSTYDRGYGRYPLKQREIAIFIAKQIRQGKLKPGDKLPIRAELKKKFDTTSTTIQRIVDHLVKDGTLQTSPRLGSFIADTPPCINDVGVVFHDKIEGEEWRGVDAALLQSIIKLRQSNPQIKIHIYDNLYPRNTPNEALINQLEDDVMLGRIGMLLCATNPFFLEKTAVFKAIHFPIFALRKGSSVDYHSWNFPNAKLHEHALINLAQAGAKNIGIIGNMQLSPNDIESRIKLLNKYGLNLRSEMVMGCLTEWAGQAAKMMLSSKHPIEGIIIEDDTLLPSVIKSIRQTNRIIGRDIHILNYCNFPLAKPPIDQVMYSGFDIEHLLKKSIEIFQDDIGKQRLRFRLLKANIKGIEE